MKFLPDPSMKTLASIVAVPLLAFVAFVAFVAFAVAVNAQAQPATQGSANPAPSTAADASPTDGEVRKVDREAQKLTLRHGPIPNLDMPGMTMVLRVADPTMLDGLEPRQKVRFKADRIGGEITITWLETAD